jgi:hypothetical protein
VRRLGLHGEDEEDMDEMALALAKDEKTKEE